MNDHNLKPFTKNDNRASEAGKKKGRHVSTLLRRIAKSKTTLSDDEKKRLEKFLGRPIKENEVDHNFLMAAGLADRARKSDASYKFFLELMGELKPDETSPLNAPVNINVNFTKPKTTDEPDN